MEKVIELNSFLPSHTRLSTPLQGVTSVCFEVQVVHPIQRKTSVNNRTNPKQFDRGCMSTLIGRVHNIGLCRCTVIKRCMRITFLKEQCEKKRFVDSTIENVVFLLKSRLACCSTIIVYKLCKLYLQYSENALAMPRDPTEISCPPSHVTSSVL